MRFYRRFLPYGVAIVSTAIALPVTLWLKPLLFHTLDAFFYIAIILTTWYGGWRPGILAVVLSTLAINYFFFFTLDRFSIPVVESILGVSFFLAVALTIVLLTSNLKEHKKKVKLLSQQLAEENAEQLRLALSAAQMGMWDWNIATGKIKWSPELEQLFGLTPGTFDGRYETFDRFIHPDDRESLNRSLQQALQTHHIYHHEYRIIWPDGSIHWLEGRGQSFYDAAGQPVKMTGTVMNIDDRKRGEAERKQAEVLLHQQLEQQRRIVEISQRIRKSLNLAEILQTTVDEMRQLLQTSRVIIFQFAPNWSGTVVVESVGSEWTAILSTQIYDPCLREKYVELFQQGLVTAKSDIYTPEIDPCYVELLANFQVKAHLVVPILNGDELWGLLISHHCGEPRQWQAFEIELIQQVVTQVGIAIQQAELVEKLQIELHQRRQTEAALRESEQKFRQLAENIEDVFFLYTADYSQLLYINSAYENIWQRTCKSLYQNPYSFLDSIHPLDRDRLIPAMDRLLNGEADFEDEYRILRPDGSIRWIYARAFFVYNEAGEPYRIAGLSSDITERKLAEIALQELNAELEQRIAERTAELTQTNSLLQQELYQRQRIEQALRESEAQFQHLVANVPGAIYRLVQSPDNSVWFEYISPAIKEMYEVEVEQILENAFLVVNPIHPDDLAEHQAEISRSRENLEIFDNEWRIITPSGKLKWLHGRSIPERRDNGDTVWYGIVQDISERKETEERLQQTLQQLSFHIENTPLATIIWDSEFRVQQWSKQAEKIFGWTAEEVFGKMMCDWQFIFEDDREIVNLKSQDVLSGKSVVCCHRNYRKDGKVIDIEWYSSTLLDEEGNLVSILSIAQDVTERNQLERALQASEAKLSDIFNSVNAGIISYRLFANRDFEYEYCSRGCETVFGYTQAELMANKALWMSRVYPEDRNIITASLDRILSEGSGTCDYRFYHKDGSLRWLSANYTARYDPSADVWMAIGVNIDISESKRAEQALKQSEEKYRRIVDTANEGIWVIDAQGNTTFVNPRMAQMLGYSVAEMMGKSMFAFMDEEGQAIAAANLEARRQGISAQHDFKFRCQDGSDFWCMIGTSPIFDETGQFLGALGMITDISDRKRVEDALRQSEEKFRQLAENIQAVFWMTDIQDRQVVYVSNAYETVWQGKCEDLYQDFSVWLDAVHPNDRQLLETVFTEQKISGRSDIEYRIIRPDGSICWIRDRAFPIRDESGKIWRIAGIAEDITDRKLTQELLQHRESTLRSFFNSAAIPMGIVELHNGDILHISDNWAAAQFFGNSIEGMQNQFSSTLGVSLATIERWTAYYQEAARTQAPVRFEYLHTTAEGQRWLSGSVCSIAVSPTGYPRFSYIVEDITDRKQAEQMLELQAFITRNMAEDLLHRVTDQLAIAIQQSELYRQLQIELHERKQTEANLREAERRWRFLLENVQLVVVGLDLTGAVSYVNPFFLKLTGYTESEALGKNWLETFLPDRDREEVQAVFSAVLAANAHPYYQNFIVTKSGEQRFIAWNNTLLRDSAGNIIGTVSIGEDITERQKIEQMKNEFISIVSHELRTPLTAIRASLGLLQTGIYDKKPEKLKRMIEIAAIDSERLVRLVNDILDLERLDSGRAVLEKTTCKAIDLIRQAVEAVQAIADRQHIAFDIHPTDIEVWAASDAIVQTLINLLSNAIKFSPPDSSITVSVAQQIDRAQFQVRDRGRGIPADKLEVIFGRFQQVDASDSRDKGGTGLGLAICRSIIDRHGGRIWAESSLGVGSTFFFTLSLRQEA